VREVSTGTWTNEKAGLQEIVITPGHWEHCLYLFDRTPSRGGVGKSLTRWTDPEGNVWYKSFATITRGDGRGHDTVGLDKFSKGATVWEYTWDLYNGNAKERSLAFKGGDRIARLRDSVST